MFKNYLIIAFRNIKNYKGFSLINVTGLATGLACAILILLWVQDELSFDHFHEKSTKIGRIIMDIDGMQIPASPGPLASAMIDEFPEVKNAVRYVWGGGIFQYKDKKFNERNTLLVEPGFFEVFSFKFLKGNPETALNDPGSIVLTNKMAEKYFGNNDPIGETIHYSSRVDIPLKVTAVLEDVPHNSSLTFDFLASFELCRNWKEPDSWTTSQDYQTYVLIDDEATIESANHSLDEFCNQFFAAYNIKMFIQPLTRIHLHSDYKFDVGHGDILYVRIFTLIAFVVLIIACINFMNLSTARFLKRHKEVGLRKVVGANRYLLIVQFLTEALLFTAISLSLAFLFVELALPAFRNITAKPLSMNYFDFRMMFASMLLLLLTAILAGSYPAFYLSSLKPAPILRQSMITGNRGALFRKILVITQFTLSIVVILSTLIVSDQLNFMRNKKLGYDKENLIYIRTGSYFSHKYEVLKHDFLQSENILAVTVSNDLPTYINLNTGADWEGKTDNSKYIGFQTIVVNEDYLKTYGMKIAEGRFYSKDFPADIQNAFVLNETAIKTMGIDSPIGKRFSAWDKDGIIIGVVKDFHFKSVREKIEPLLLHLGHKNRFYQYLTLKIRSEKTAETISYIEKTWKTHLPDHLYEIHFLDQTIEQLYTSEKKIKMIFSYFAFIAIFISCLGLFGLAIFMAETRTKEIGVRKVVGASFTDIIRLLSFEFIKWVFVANLVALPVGYLIMNKWLQNFEYRINLSVWTFISAGSIALLTAILTVIYHSTRAALANPVESLKYE